MKRKVVIAAALLAAVAVLIAANLRNVPASGGGSGARGPKGAPEVRVQAVQRSNLRQEVIARGVLEARDVQEIRAPFATKAVTLLVGIGDRVTEGQPLAVLDTEDLALQIAAQEAQVAGLEAQVAELRLRLQEAPLQLNQSLINARSALVQAEDNLSKVLRQEDALRTRLEQARANLTALQNRSTEGAEQVAAARAALLEAEEAYKANPADPARRAAYEQARSAYDEAVRQSQQAAEQAAAQLRAAYDELAAAEEEYARVSGDNPVAVQLAVSQVEAARIALQLAEMEAESGGTLAEQVRAAELQLAAARANLDSLREKLSQAQLTAPAAGTVLAVAVQDGTPVQAMQLILTLGDLDALKVKAQVDELDITKVQPGQPLTVETNAAPGERFEGRVTRVAAQATEAGGSPFFVVEGEVANRDGLLRAGLNAEVTIATAERKDVIVVPAASLRTGDGGESVLVVEEFTVKVRPVVVGLRTETEVEILEGLREGERVVVSPFTLINSLQEGDAVRVEEVDANWGRSQ